MRRLTVLAAVVLIGGCHARQAEPAKPAPAANATASAAAVAVASADGASASASASDAKGVAVAIKNKLMEFDYSYPAAAAAIPALKSWLDSDLAEKKEATAEGTRDELAEAKKNPEFFAHTYAHSTKWQVVTEIPGWLSLSAQRWEYTGGAHGNPWFESLLWDKAANVRRDPLDLFTSKAALSAAIRQPFCAQIDKQRAQKRGEPVKRNSGDEFDACIDPVESTVILGSTDKQHFNRIGVLVGPYAAGPYVEGNYEATLPVTPAVIAAVKPQYRALFAVGR
ncbi:MAG: DUF4163 domain-containing protein [Sphingomonadales bacterium]|nr:DUF4163 domain-containing protein [Sphingomonadales bacterium]